MAHCPPEKLRDLTDLFDEIEGLTGITRKSYGVFYVKSKAFLHFHIKGDERWADVCDGNKWAPKIPIRIGANKGKISQFRKAIHNYYKACISRS